MSQTIFSVDHHLAELRQVGDDLRAERYADQVRHAGSRQPGSVSILFRDLLSSLQSPARSSRGNTRRVATH
jgi:hypothetical protein